MTIIRGARVLTSPCCGAWYSAPRYISMNFSALEYWTDGWRHGSLMPNDVGLCRCKCGRLVLSRDLVEIMTVEASDLPRIDRVPEEAFADCLDEAEGEVIEAAVRLGYWRYLNHPFRQKYREHRDAAEANARAAWAAANPDRRSLWDKLRGRKQLGYSGPHSSPFTCPAFEPSDLQCRNMKRLTEILVSQGTGLPYGHDPFTLAELLREQGRFDEAQSIISTVDDGDDDVTVQVISTLIKERQQAPVRYRV